MRKSLIAITCLFSSGMALGVHAAQSYPTKPIRLVLGVGTGGVGDITNRLFAEHMSEGLGQRIVVDNRPSAGGVISAMTVKNANADGYTLLQAGNGVAIRAALYKSLPFDIRKDFVQVSSVAFFQLILVARPDSGFGSLRDVIEFARGNPGKLDIGTIAAGSTQFLAAELLKSVAGIQVQTVPYKSNSLLMAALRGNELRVAFELVGPVLAPVKNNQLKALAVGSDRRFGGLPEVPTIAESGLPDFNVSSWTGVSAPAGTPSAIVDRLSREIIRVANIASVRQKLQEIGIEARGCTPSQAQELMNQSIERWNAVIDRAKIQRH